MKCRECGKGTIVADTRLVDGVRFRKRTCECGWKFYTQETVIEKWPFKDPRIGRNTHRRKQAAPQRKKVVRKKSTKPEPSVFTPAMKEWGIKITKDSPLWLKSIALKLG